MLLGGHRAAVRASCPAALSAARRRAVISVRAEDKKWPFGGKGNSEDAARKALQDSFNPKKFGGFGQQKPADTPGQANKGGGLFSSMFGQGSGGSGGLGGSGGGGGGGGGGGFGGSPSDDSSRGPEKPILQDLMEFMQGTWIVAVNTALFLGFACMLHRSLDWCCQVELLLLVGAPQQAFERVAGRFFAMIEWVEKHLLGWDIPGDEDMMPLYQNIRTYYPEEHAYTFAAYRYDMPEHERDTLKKFYALRHWERDGGVRGDVDAQDVRRILDKYEPMEADRREYARLKSAGRLDEYWTPERIKQCQDIVAMRK